MHNFLTLINEANGIDNPARFPLYPANQAENQCRDKCEPGEDPINIPFL